MEDITIIPRPKTILYIGYNYNSSYFMIGTDIGFQVHQTYPLALKFSRILNGGIGLVQNLNKSNIFCLVGGGVSPKYAPNKLLIWDDKQNKEIYEFRFNSFVLNCFIKQKYIFVFCKDTINIISVQAMKTVEIILTIDNPDGIGTISSNVDKYILSWPDLAKGNIAIKDFSELKSSSVILNANNQDKNSIFKQKLIFKAHKSDIVFLKLNSEGNRLASASQRGNIIRIFDTIKGDVLQELKRGTGDAKIYSINFSFDNNFMALTSDHGTAHIFVINKNIKEVTNTLANSSKVIKEQENIKNNHNKNKDIQNIKKDDVDDFDIIDKEDNENDNEDKEIIINKDDDNDDDKEVIINKDDKEDNKEKNNNDNFEIIDNDLTNSEVFEKSKNSNFGNQKSILSGVSKIIGFSNIFQNEWSFTSFKIPYKYQSFISFIPGDKNNNKVIVVDKIGNYTVAEINNEKESKIIQKDLLI